MHGHHYEDADCGPSAWRGSDCRHRHIGFCRCDRGPHAYYMGEDGKIHSPVMAVPEAEEEKISELEEQIKRLRDDLQNAMSEIERLKGMQPKDH
ncbi:MAG: hypothetical protein NO516_02445 [Candidatus Methanomethylicia archaeon]|nr:hypothetical protein [Candidatus Methanomethylicia archaeon]